MSIRGSRIHAMLASMMAFAGFPYQGDRSVSPRRISKHNGRRRKERRYKPAFSMGYRGTPRTTTPNRMPAPTIDQVRDLERKYGQRLIVVRGLIWFRDKVPFTHEEAERRQLNAVPEPV